MNPYKLSELRNARYSAIESDRSTEFKVLCSKDQVAKMKEKKQRESEEQKQKRAKEEERRRSKDKVIYLFYLFFFFFLSKILFF